MTRALRILTLALGALLLLAGFTAGGTRAQEIMKIDFAGGIPGYLEDSKVVGNHAFCAARSGLLVLDIGDPQHPTQVAFLPLAGAYAICIDGRYAYVSAGSTSLMPRGIHIVDIDDPASPVLLGHCDVPGRSYEVIVDGDIAYVMDSSNGLRVFDISKPPQMIQIAFLPYDSHLHDMDLQGDILCLADQYNGLRLIDVSAPSSPVEVGRFDPDHDVFAVAMRGKLAYVAALPCLRIIDISDPSSPVEVAQYEAESTTRQLTLSGDRAYLYYDDRLRILDISLPTEPVELGSVDIYAHFGPITVVGDMAYIAAAFGGLRLVDASDPMAPVEVGDYLLVGDVYDVALDGNSLFLAGGFHCSGESPPLRDDAENRDQRAWWPYSGLFTIDVGELKAPELMAYCPCGNASDVWLEDDLALVINYPGSFDIFDVSDPAAAKQISSIYLNGWNSSVSAKGDLACVSCTGGHLYLIDIGDPSAPVELSNISVDSGDVEIQGDYAYVTNYHTGLHIVDISEPSAPYEVANLDMPGSTADLTVDGNRAYIANSYGLLIIDISNPEAPVELGGHDTPGNALRVAVEGDHAYVADRDGGVRVINISDAANMVEVGYYVTPYPALHVAVDGGRIAVGIERGGGLFMLRTRQLTGVDDEGPVTEAAPRCVLGQNCPNPFNPRTEIPFSLAVNGRVRLTVHTLDGRRVATLIDEHLPAGDHTAAWNGRNDGGRLLTSGIYLCRLAVGTQADTRKMLLLK